MTGQQGRRRVLFVCTANICRSPTAELLARHRFGESDMMFRSAGFLDVADTCPSDLVDVLAVRGIDATTHRSYRLDETSVNAAELLLTMEGSHVQKATMLAPAAFSKIVPLREAAAIIERSPEPRLSIEDFISDLNNDRDPRQYLGGKWDVADPYGRRAKAYRSAVDEIEQLVTTVIGRLR